MRKKYVVRLTDDEREQCRELIRCGTAPARRIMHAQVLLKADASPEGPGWTDAAIAEAFGVCTLTVGKLRKTMVTAGLQSALDCQPPVPAQTRRPRRSPSHCSDLQCAARRAYPVELAAAVSAHGRTGLCRLRVTCDGRAGPKKNELQPWRTRRFCIPPRENAEFVSRMEDILDVYCRAYDPLYPVVCLDESAKQLLKHVREPLAMEPGQPQRIDDHYERNGTANLFLACEPLRGWREIKVTARRTKLDWAHFVRELVDGHYPHAARIVLVMDNLNTHRPASLYEAFEPAEAKRIWDRLEIHHTPRHGSWLNIAECEFSVLSSQCTNRRLPDPQALTAATRAWAQERNHHQAPVQWQFATADARIKLVHLYPKIQS